jgi:diketogulonate reductase-like aldo/keto reductase
MTTDPATSVPTLPLNSGGAIPQLGFGVFEVPPAATRAAVLHALEAGYRSIDTAELYRNEREVGEAIAQCGLDRGELFVTTKLWTHGRESALRTFDASLDLLGLDYIDLYLIHWPLPSQDRYVETWKALIEIAASGRTRAIGVSNFLPEHLERIITQTGVVPAVNQVELHPRHSRPDVRAADLAHGIVTESWSPLEQAAPALFGDPAVVDAATAHGKSAAQVILRWHIQLGCVVIPRSVKPARIAENFAIFDFALSEAELERITALDARARIGPDPAVFAGG